MLLRNYYAMETCKIVSSNNLTEEVSSSNIAPRVSRDTYGNYSPTSPSYYEYYYGITQPSIANGFPSGDSSSYLGRPYLVLGKSNNEVTFDDYTLSLNNNVSGTYKSTNTIYDENTHTYTTKTNYVLSNNSSTESATFNELGIVVSGRYGAGGSYNNATPRLIIRELLGNNAFILEPLESANLELTIKYTIAQPLQ